MIRRRQYQTDALKTSREYYDRGVTRQLMEIATGLGKTAGIATQLPEFYPQQFDRAGDDGGLVFIVHRREIVRSTAAAFRAQYPDRWVGVEMGEEHAVGDEDIIIVSVDSLGRLMSNRVFKYQHRRPGIVIFDEAHHLTVDGTWDNVATFFGVGSDKASRFAMRNGVMPLSLLLTATPDRHDGKALSPFVDPLDGKKDFRPVVKLDYRWGVENGWLCDIVAYHMTATGHEREIDVILRALRDYGKGHQTLVFAPSVADSAELAQTLRSRGMASAAHVDALTEGEERMAAFDGFRAGRISVLTNYAVFTEGVDLPNTSLIIDANPSESRPLFAQKVGRAGRPHMEARVDDCDGVEERLAAIAASPKPYATYVAGYDPTRHSLSVYSVLTGDPRAIHQPGKTVIGEIVDTLEYFESVKPAVPVRDIRSLDDIEITLREANVWTQTVYNDRLHALSPLAWVALGETLALHIPSNPWAKDPTQKMATVVSFAPVREGGKVVAWDKTTTLSGGWCSALRAPVKKRVLKTERVRSVQKAVTEIDLFVKTKKPADHARLTRRPHAAPDGQQVRYLTNAGIKYEPNGLTAATADLLINAHRTKRVLGIE